MEGTGVGATVGSPLGRLGTRFKKPFRPLPLVPVVAPVLLVGAGVWPVPVSGSGTDGTLESAPCKAEPTCWAQPRAAVTTALASSASAWSWAPVLAMIAACTSFWIAEVSGAAQPWTAPEMALAAAASLPVSLSVPFVPGEGEAGVRLDVGVGRREASDLDGEA